MNSHYEPRMLVVSVGAENKTGAVESSLVNQLLNALFSAHRLGIRIDTCDMNEVESRAIKMASSVSSGVYFRPNSPDILMPFVVLCFCFFCNIFMQLHFLPSTSLLKSLPTALLPVDGRSVCLCHGQYIDKGWVCPVCTSGFKFCFIIFLNIVYCSARNDCLQCGYDQIYDFFVSVE